MSSRKKSKQPRKAPRPGKKKTGRGGVILNRLGLVAVAGFVAFALYVTVTKPPSQTQTGPRAPARTGTPWE